LCPEDCAFCSQSVEFPTDAPRYRLQSADELVDGAREAARLGAVKYCMVTSTRGPSQRDLDVICEAVRRIKAEVNIRICTSLGLLKEGQAERCSSSAPSVRTSQSSPPRAAGIARAVISCVTPT
ncbi:MAG: radical SAM protein, partial [Gemmatimonadales bacterium]